MAEIIEKDLIRLSKSCLCDTEKRAVMGVLDREHLGMGVEVQEFEEALTEFFGRPSVCVVNGTAALHLSLQAAGIGYGDEVLVQSLTYIASFQAISATGASPVACDIDPVTLTLDWRDAEKRITAKTKAVMPVHYASGAGALDEIYLFAKKYRLKVIEDAAHAFGSNYKGNRIGSIGDVACFSFDGIKNITSGEGGCIVTDDKEILQKVRDARLLGVKHDTEARYQGGRSWNFDVTAQGWRYHMSNIMAAIGMVQLESFPDIAVKRCALAERYTIHFNNQMQIIPILSRFDSIVPHIYTIRIIGLSDRDGLRECLRDNGIESGVHYLPNHHLAYYRASSIENLPVTDRIHSELLTLPLHPDMSMENVDYVAEVLIKKLPHYLSMI